MEPRPFSRGYIPIQPPLTFLGSPSMEPRPFSRGYVKTSSEVSAQPISFNGATAFQPWIRSPLPCAATQDTPSMEPRPFSRGYIRKKTQTGGICVAFNGATAFQPWILRPDGSPAQCACSLQWSHGLSAVDTPRARCGRRHNPDPSMEPRPFSRGYVALPHILDDARFYLQWSHGLSAVDTPSSLHTSPSTPSLQWSHGLSAVDTFLSWCKICTYLCLQWSHGLSAVDTRTRAKACIYRAL